MKNMIKTTRLKISKYIGLYLFAKRANITEKMIINNNNKTLITKAKFL